MIKLIASSLAALVLLGLAPVYAGGDGCCMKGKAGAMSGCTDILSKLNLTPDQQTKIAALKADCEKTGWKWPICWRRQRSLWCRRGRRSKPGYRSRKLSGLSLPISRVMAQRHTAKACRECLSVTRR